MDRKALFALILCVSSLILMSVSVPRPWYQLSMESGGVETQIDVFFEHGEITVYEDGEVSTTTDNYDNRPNIKTVMGNTYGLICLGLFVLVIGLMVIVLNILEKIGNRSTAILLVFAAVFILLTPLYMMFALPPAIGDDFADLEGTGMLPVEPMSETFFGSNEDVNNAKWGGGPGWFLTIFTAVFIGTAAMLLLFSRHRTRVAPIGRAELRRSTQLRTSEDSSNESQPTYEGRKTVIEEDEGWIRY